MWTISPFDGAVLGGRRVKAVARQCGDFDVRTGRWIIAASSHLLNMHRCRFDLAGWRPPPDLPIGGHWHLGYTTAEPIAGRDDGRNGGEHRYQPT